MTGRLQQIIRSSWHLAVGAPWGHDPLDPSRVPAVSLDPVGPWYYDLGRSIVRGDYHLLDERGIPRMLIGNAVVYHPSRIASFSLAHATRYAFKADPADREKAIFGARWLAEQQPADGPLAGAFPFTFSMDDLAPPWASALTQGQGMSALARAYVLTRDEALGRAAVAAMGPLRRSVEEGGVRSRFHGSASIWFEEYPHAAHPSHVLNGFIYALLGLRDVSLLGLGSEAGELYRAGLASLATHLPAFDVGYWSYYNCPDRARPRRASLAYHQLHCVLLRSLSARESDHVFAQTADRWESYLARRWCRLRTLAAKFGDWR